jgi:UDP-N-acetylmuramoyl-tripeptide--D-alanyl-D-alanine ligase
VIARRLSEIAAAVDGRAVGEDVTVSSAASDSRAAVPGSLFVALPGERVDGHDFVGEAMAHGAVAALVTRPVDAPYVEVPDTGPRSSRSPASSVADGRTHGWSGSRAQTARPRRRT